MSQSSNGYKSILHGTALFGGVQIFIILINLVRGKFVALLLGPEGMGISSLLMVSATTIQQFSGLGLNLSGVKEVAVAKEKGNIEYLSFVVATLRRLLYLTAIAGALFSILFCSYLSRWTFGTEQYQWYFVFLSIVIFFTTLANGELSVLQGLHQVKKLALSSVIGSSVGLFIGIPLYYFYGYKGIVPAMIALSLTTYIFYRRYSGKAVPVISPQTWKKMYPLARKMVLLGILMMIATLLGTLANYILNAFISKTGSLNDVGLYQAANSITNQYVGLVFTAMSLDFFPRLASACTDNEQVRGLVNRQTEIVLLVVAPLSILLIITAPILIRLLLTSEFLKLVPVIRWMGLGIFFKAIAFPMGYISFSKGDKKTFLWMEGIGGNFVLLSLNMIGYFYWGIVGLGISFVVFYLVMTLIYIGVTRRLYAFYHDKNVRFLVVLFLFLLSSAFVCSYIPSPVYAYSSMIFLLLFTSGYSIYELNKRTDIIHVVKQKLRFKNQK